MIIISIKLMKLKQVIRKTMKRTFFQSRNVDFDEPWSRQFRVFAQLATQRIQHSFLDGHSHCISPLVSLFS